MSRPCIKPWTPAEEAYLRDNRGKKSYAEIAERLGRTKAAITKRASHLGLSCCIDGYNGIPMEQALSPAECDKMRDFLRALVHYSNRGRVDIKAFIQQWRLNEYGYINARKGRVRM